MRGRINEDWEVVTNQERSYKVIPILPQTNMKLISAIIPIMLNLWRRRCEVVFGNTRKSKINNKREILSKKIDKLKDKTNNTTGR